MKVSCLCARAGMSRQNFYKERKRRRHDAVDEGLVKTLVNDSHFNNICFNCDLAAFYSIIAKFYTNGTNYHSSWSGIFEPSNVN